MSEEFNLIYNYISNAEFAIYNESIKMNDTIINFKKDVIDISFKIPIVVDFWAEWCAPCRILGPVLEKLANESKDKWKLVKINTELQPEMASQYDISSIPAVKMFSKGEIIADFVGALPEQNIKKWLNGNLPSESIDLMQEAVKFLQNGDKEKAKRFLEMSVSKDDTNLEAKVLFAQIIFHEDSEKAVELVKDVDEAHPLFDYVDALRVLHNLIVNYEVLNEKATKLNSESWKLYAEGIKFLKKMHYERAMEFWLEALEIDKTLDNDNLRKACVALFKISGNHNELNDKYHRRFTSALF